MCVLASYLVEGWHLWDDDDHDLMVPSVMLCVRAEKKHLWAQVRVWCCLHLVSIPVPSLHLCSLAANATHRTSWITQICPGNTSPAIRSSPHFSIHNWVQLRIRGCFYWQKTYWCVLPPNTGSDAILEWNSSGFEVSEPLNKARTPLKSSFFWHDKSTCVDQRGRGGRRGYLL